MERRKRVIITMEDGPMFVDVFQPDIMADLRQYADVRLNDLGRRMTTQELADRVTDVDAIITAWGTPRIDVSVLDRAPNLKIVSHAAGSVKRFYAEEMWDRGIVVTNAASAIATYVGEFTLLAALALLRSLPKYTHGAQTQAWQEMRCDGWETLLGKTVGLIGLGQTARSFLRYLAPYNCRLIAYDPYLPPEKAAELGVELVSLEELLSTAKVISLHAPITEETKGMLNAERLALISDGAVFINTARGILIDHDALARELATGRFKAALDVTHPEPLRDGHPLRGLPNVLLTPHVAGPTKDGRRDLFKTVVEDLKLFWSGKAPQNVVTKEMLDTMA